MNIFTLTILFPLLSFIILSISQGKFLEHVSATIGIIGVGISTLITFYLIFSFCSGSYDYTSFLFIQEFWTWFKIDELHIKIMFRLDMLSLVMLSVITIIGLVIHIYSIWYMKGDPGFSRFFSYTNLFMANMILMILSDNLLLMYLGWEGISLCSYLLIGFHYFNPKNGIEAFKAFIITRFGDICLLCALIIIYDQFHTLNLYDLLNLNYKQSFSNVSNWITILILVGSIGKSAQIPLNTWLVRAMVGPTPISALIHSATMVTSGVYLIDRMKNFFLETPDILYVTGILGSITLIVFSFSALFQNNIKKILAYSTISQIGYMFLALGGKNWIGAIFHLMTHACSKALLFLTAGSIIRLCNNEQNIFKMKILHRTAPFIYVCFLFGGASLSGFPIITAGFYSKELILLNIFFENKDKFLLLSALLGTILTPIYIFRMIFVIFHRTKIIPYRIRYAAAQCIPLLILLLLSTFIVEKVLLLIINLKNDFYVYYQYNNTFFILISEMLIFFGIWTASLFWYDSWLTKKSYLIVKELSSEKIIRYLVLLCHYGWGIDWLYKKIFINPYLLIAKKITTNYSLITFFTDCFSVFTWIGKHIIFIEYKKLNWYLVFLNIGMIFIFVLMIINLFLYL